MTTITGSPRRSLFGATLGFFIGFAAVALFGPSGESEWGPWNVARRVVTSGHTCRPCGQDGCGGGKLSECLTLLPVEAVHSAARELLGSGARAVST